MEFIEMSKILHKNYYSENRKERGEKRFKEKRCSVPLQQIKPNICLL